MDFLKDLAGPAYALLGALLALLGVSLTNRSNDKRLQIQHQHELERDESKERRARTEELYLLAEAWAQAAFFHDQHYLLCMQGHMTYNDALDKTIEQGEKDYIDYKRLEMLVDLYLPELRPDLDAVQKARSKVNDVLSAHKARYKAGDFDGSEFVQPFLKAQKGLIDESAAFKVQVIAAARNRSALPR